MVSSIPPKHRDVISRPWVHVLCLASKNPSQTRVKKEIARTPLAPLTMLYTVPKYVSTDKQSRMDGWVMTLRKSWMP